MVAPSDMMDAGVAAIRASLDWEGYTELPMNATHKIRISLLRSSGSAESTPNLATGFKPDGSSKQKTSAQGEAQDIEEGRYSNGQTALSYLV
jgi:hypothetical protein